MKQYFDIKEVRDQFKKNSIIAGILLLFAGIIGIFLPEVTSLTLSIFIGWLLIIGGIIAGYQVIKSYTTKWLAWFKPLILVTVGFLDRKSVV